MATALQRQLAQIAANSTHQLDLKAQRTQHSKSLLFEPNEASRQSFDDIYGICIEGFEELCEFDSRFTQFAASLFSESSKDIDRGQLSQAENEELDGVLNRFLGLIQGRILLKPAQKSLEWLIRRYRVHEYNTETLLLTCLPYHADEYVFPTLMSILPTDKQLPESFKWLHPYVASLSCPPRHALLSAMVTNRGLFAAFNSYILRIARAGFASSLALGCWAGVTAQAVNGMIDSSRSGREAVRKQREEELLLRVLPILQDALHISRKRQLDEMFVGSCMIVMILATKASLSNATLDAMMEAVARAWTESTISEGLSCLAIIAEEKENAQLSDAVVKALFKDNIYMGLLQQAQSQRVSRLAAGTAIGIVKATTTDGPTPRLSFVKAILQPGILQETDAAVVIGELSSKLQSRTPQSDLGAISGLLATVVESPHYSNMIQQLRVTTNLPELQQQQHSLLPPETDQMELNDPSILDNLDANNGLEAFTRLIDSLPQLPPMHTSLLEPSPEAAALSKSYCQVFEFAVTPEQFAKETLGLTLLFRSSLEAQPSFLSLLARTWSSGYPSITTSARLRALTLAKRELDSVIQAAKSQAEQPGKLQIFDLQALLPYVFVALGHGDRRIRKAAAELCSTLNAFYILATGRPGGYEDMQIWEEFSLYTQKRQESSASIRWLPSQDAHNFLRDGIMPILEDSLLDATAAQRHLSSVLNRRTSGKADDARQHKTLSRDTCSNIAVFLASHARATPVLAVTLSILSVLSAADKTATAVRQDQLTSYAKEWFELSDKVVDSWCRDEGVSVRDVDVDILQAFSNRSQPDMEMLRDICTSTSRAGTVEPAFNRLRQAYTDTKDLEFKINTVHWLLDTTLGMNKIERVGAEADQAKDHATETLRSVELPKEIMVNMLGSLPVAADLETQPPTSKRQRRTSEAERPRAVHGALIKDAIARITLVAEMIEAANDRSAVLLRPLFHLLSSLRQWKSLVGSELTYLHGVLLDVILAVVKRIESSPSAAELFNKDDVRVDILIDYVRSTSSPQIHNTALLIVSSLAILAPDSVLHSVIPLFTFMSSTVLRKTDDYSAHAVDQAVSQIVPALASSLKREKRTATRLRKVADLLLSFVAAWEHIPLHRRLGLFEMLIRSIGADDCLGYATCMLVERYRSKAVTQFVIDLAYIFESSTIVAATNQWISLICAAVALTPASHSFSVKTIDDFLSFSDKNKEEQHETTEIMIEGLTDLLNDKNTKRGLAVEVRSFRGETLELFRKSYDKLLLNAMQLVQGDEVLPAQFQESLEGLLSAALDFVPTGEFIVSCSELMQVGSAIIRKQVFNSLEGRAVSAKASNADERQTFLNALPSCAAFVTEYQPLEVRMAAVACIDAICEKFGKSDRGSVENAAQRIAGPAALGSDDYDLRVLSLLCLASIAGVLGDGDESVAIFPGVVSTANTYLAESLQRSPDPDHMAQRADEEAMQIACFRLLTAILDNIPLVLISSPDNLNRALRSAAGSFQHDAVVEFKTLVARDAPLSVLCKSVQRVWQAHVEDLENLPASAITFARNIVEILREAVQHHNNARITANASLLLDALMLFFDLRRNLLTSDSSLDLEVGNEAFASVDTLAMDMVYKLNDRTFRPFFARKVEWATTALLKKDTNGRVCRQLALYKFALRLFEELKSVVTDYMSFLLEDVGEILRRTPDDSTSAELLELVVMTIGSSFRNDNDDFWTAPAHFDIVAVPLVDLLKADFVQASERSSELIEGLIATIAELASAVSASPEQLKSMNGNLLALMRHNSTNVRLAAVQCQRAVTKEVNVEWLALLPELLPVISELQEDDDERVERETLLWVAEIEEINGESLEGMLA